MTSPDVDILLATYNGGKFLGPLLESLLAQSHAGWRLRVRDNGSTDDTLQVLDAYARRMPARLRRLEDADGNVGACQSFARLLRASEAPYAMFCDCDDVWLPDKIDVTLDKMRRMEARYGRQSPLLVHTDLKVVGAGLEAIAPSFWAFQHLRPDKGRGFARLLMQNVVTGCTAMVNRPLRELAVPVPAQAIMHDWWLALVAAAFGQVDYVDRATILYRQHGGNDVGAKRWDAGYVLRAAGRFQTLRDRLARNRAQARALVDRYADRLGGRELAAARACANLDGMGFLGKRLSLLRHGLLKCGLARNVGLFLAV